MVLRDGVKQNHRVLKATVESMEEVKVELEKVELELEKVEVEEVKLTATDLGRTLPQSPEECKTDEDFVLYSLAKHGSAQALGWGIHRPFVKQGTTLTEETAVPARVNIPPHPPNSPPRYSWERGGRYHAH